MMLSREQFIDVCKNEALIIKHLYTKLDKSKLDWRPSANQRSVQELLEYIPCIPYLTPQCVISGDFASFGPAAAEIKAGVAKDFDATFDAEMVKMIKLVNSIPDADLQNKEVKMPTGVSMKLGIGLVGTVYRFLSAYKMPLFLYAKESTGNANLTTWNVWAGQDRPEKKNG